MAVTERRIWTFNDVYIRIFALDDAGNWNPDDDPILQYCYATSAALSGSLEVERRDRECMNKRELIANSDWDSYKLTVSGLSFNLDAEMDFVNIINREKKLAIEVLHRGLGQKEDKRRTLSDALCVEHNLSGSDNSDETFQIVFDGTTVS